MAAPLALAGAFLVTPVRVTLSEAQPVAALTVRNDGAEKTVVQVDLTSWTQQEGNDVYAPTRELLATPPIFTLEPGGSQVVRVGLRRAVDAQRELPYRIFLQEVLPPPAGDFKGLRVALRVGVPVFVVPAGAVAPKLRWSAARAGDGWTSVSVRNEGNAHVQIAELRFESARGQELGRPQATYVLGGQTRQWRLKANEPLIRVLGRGDAGEIAADLSVATR